MTTISIEIACVWKLKDANHYLFTKDGRCYNAQTGRELKQAYNSRCIGFYIKGKFRSLTKIKKQLEKIPTKEILPF
jgi:hypothetical protein